MRIVWHSLCWLSSRNKGVGSVVVSDADGASFSAPVGVSLWRYSWDSCCTARIFSLKPQNTRNFSNSRTSHCLFLQISSAYVLLTYNCRTLQIYRILNSVGLKLQALVFIRHVLRSNLHIISVSAFVISPLRHWCFLQRDGEADSRHRNVRSLLWISCLTPSLRFFRVLSFFLSLSFRQSSILVFDISTVDAM